MSRGVLGTTGTGDDRDAQWGLREPPTLAVEIHFYGAEEPISIPLPGLDATKAETYFERLKSDVIEAQLHNDLRISIKPPARGQDVLILDPSTIKQAVLVDPSEPDEPTTDEIPAVAGTDRRDDAVSAVPGRHEELPVDLQRRITKLLD
ncbi:MAG: hypothetical protein M3313_17245 [Actinomycetota bacterium]|nr:hypothetical protein [Actinomycetota bacterium]